jgi:hypothetical protein
MRRFIAGAAALVAAFVVSTQPAAACAGLIGPNGAVNLLRTTTFAGYHDGIEHYVTSFKFQGGSGQFGSLVPLPGVPTLVEKGGDWTLQRLLRETDPVKLLRAPVAFGAAVREDAQVLMQVKIDALDITVLPRCGLRRRRRQGEGPEHRRRHAGPHHDPDRKPLGPTAHPRHRQERG